VTTTMIDTCPRTPLQGVTDLRDQLPAFEAAARRLLTKPRPTLTLVHAKPARCHPQRALYARGLCKSCYELAWQRGTLAQHPTKRAIRCRADFVADYELLRSEGYTRTQIAERLRMRRNTLDAAYNRAVRAGALTPDRRIA
jgi:hypothetical protein